MSETKLQVVQKEFSQRTPSEIITDDKVKNKFVNLYQLMHGKKNGDIFYQTESFHFLKQISEKPDLSNCDRMSIYGCFIDVAVNGLSFDPGMKQVYLVPYGGKCTLMISPYGELFLRQRSGQIKYADNPVLVYEGDTFKVGTKDGHGFVEHESKFPRTSENIIACYVKLVRADDSIDFKVLSRPEIENLRKSSKQPNGAAWVNHFAGMVQAKTLKHAFKSYPRIKVRGDFARIEQDEVSDETISYELEDANTPLIATSAANMNGTTKITPNIQANGNGAPVSQAAKVAAATMLADEEGGHTIDDGGLFN